MTFHPRGYPPSRIYMPSKFGNIVCSIREVISIRILKMTAPGTRKGGAIFKKVETVRCSKMDSE